VVGLIEGFGTPYGMELLATVHWVARQESAKTAQEAISQVYSWSNRKQMFQREHIALAWDVLDQAGWFSAGKDGND
jgi:hypothetical protein